MYRIKLHAHTIVNDIEISNVVYYKRKIKYVYGSLIICIHFGRK